VTGRENENASLAALLREVFGINQSKHYRSVLAQLLESLTQQILQQHGMRESGEADEDVLASR
jgi:hypothetical protein